MDVIGKMPAFWKNLTSPLFKKVGLEETDWNDDLAAQINVAIVSLGVLSIELYNKGNEGEAGIEAGFAAAVKKLTEEEKLILWLSISTRLTSVKCSTSATPASSGLALLSSIQRLVLVSTSQKGVFSPPSSLCHKLVNTAVYSLKEVLQNGLEDSNLQIGVLLSSLTFQMVKHWALELPKPGDVVARLDQLLVLTFSHLENSSPQLQLGILASLLKIVQQCDDPKTIQDSLPSLLRSLGTLIQQTLRLYHKKANDEDAAIRSQLNLTAVALLHELFHILEDDCASGGAWLQAVGGSLPVAALLSATHFTLVHKPSGAADLLQATLLLFCSLAKRGASAEALHGCGVTEHLVIPLEGATYAAGAADADLQVWRLALRLYAAMLTTLQLRFLKDAFDLVGCHHERLLWSLLTACSTLEPPVMEEAAIVTQLLYRLSAHVSEWHLQLPHTFPTLLNSVLVLLQSAACLLQKPTLLHLSSSSISSSDSQKGRPVSKSPAPGVVSQVQLRLLHIVAGCLSVLRRFTPSLTDVLTHPTFDLAAWPNLISLGFTATDSECCPSFGTFLACVTCSTSLMSKLDLPAEEASNPATPTRDPAFLLPPPSEEVKSGVATLSKLHALLNYILENALHVTLTQCSRYLRDPKLSSREKQLLKRELATELNTFLSSMSKVVRKSSTTSTIPLTTKRGSISRDRKTSAAGGLSTSTLGHAVKDRAYCRLVNVYIKQVLNK